ncbi:MAG: class I SAM-dependent methyltransferase, partial [Pseudomonadota bacterium]
YAPRLAARSDELARAATFAAEENASDTDGADDNAGGAGNQQADRLYTDATSGAVAAQYEERPYPRWTSMRRPPSGALLRALSRHFPAERLAFTRAPFDVLIAGCGTGRHAIGSTIGYGANANVTAIDLSARSLAYASAAAQKHGVPTIRFERGDLLDARVTPGPFDIIECVGVLHHLADPLAGLDALLARLRPGGLMQIALYSAVAREDLSELRLEPGFPGTDCDDDAARRFRAVIRDRPAEEPGGELTISADFWSLSGFRDLVLHVNEHQFRLPEIEAALAKRRLDFCGFTLPAQVVDDFLTANPTESWPGSLQVWWNYEQVNPRTFDAMYSFWVAAPMD